MGDTRSLDYGSYVIRQIRPLIIVRGGMGARLIMA